MIVCGKIKVERGLIMKKIFTIIAFLTLSMLLFAQKAGDKITFNTTDLNGNHVTSELFAKNKLTMINIWGTFCPPCIEEMPELAKLSASLPENAQIIGILCDVSLNDKSALQDAKSIVSKAGTNYPCLLLNDSLTDYLSQFMYVPTTIFVDSEGNQIGEPVVGADFNAYTVRLQKVIGDWTKN